MGTRRRGVRQLWIPGRADAVDLSWRRHRLGTAMVRTDAGAERARLCGLAVDCGASCRRSKHGAVGDGAHSIDGACAACVDLRHGHRPGPGVTVMTRLAV